MKRILLLCDVDGTLTGTIFGSPFKQHPHDVLVLPGVVEMLNHFYNNQCEIFGISNQGGVEARKKVLNASFEENLKAAILEMQYTLVLLPQLKGIYFCPDFKGMSAWYVSKEQNFSIKDSQYVGKFRKPDPGLLLHACHVSGYATSEAWYIGDRPEDSEAASRAGIKFLPSEIMID